jgi:hypothetical protein
MLTIALRLLKWAGDHFGEQLRLRAMQRKTKVAASSTFAPSTMETFFRMAVYGLLLFGALKYNAYGAPEYWFADEMTSVIEGMEVRGTLKPPNFIYPGGLQIYPSLFLYKLYTVIFGSRNALDKVSLITIARVVSAAFFIMTVYFSERAICTITGRAQDIKTVVLVGTSCALIHHAHIATVQSSNFFGIALAYHAIAQTIVSGMPGAYYWAAFACGVATSAKWNGIIVGAVMPFVYIYLFRPNLLQLFRGMVLTGLVSASAILLFNPFVIFSFDKFKEDLFVAALKEAPFYYKTPPSLATTVGYAAFYLQAFFTDWGAVLVSATVAAALSASVGYRLRRGGGNSTSVLRIIFFSDVIIVSMVAFFVVQTRLNIHQSRYYIPLGIAVALLYSLSLDTLLIWMRQWTYLPVLRASVTGLLSFAVGVVLILNVVNGIIHVAAFPLSAKYAAEKHIETVLNSSSNQTVLRLSYGTKTAAMPDPKVCGSRCNVLELDLLPRMQEISTWDEYLAAIAERIATSRPTMIVGEELLFHNAIFLPTRLSLEYYRRLEYPNPGLQAWQKMFIDLGYATPIVFPRISGYEKVSAIIGDKYLTTIEGIAGSVYLWKRR